MLSARVPSGVTRALRLKLRIEVSGFDTAFPANVDSAPSFDPRSKPAKVVFANRTGPAMTSLSTAR